MYMYMDMDMDMNQVADPGAQLGARGLVGRRVVAAAAFRADNKLSLSSTWKLAV